ncbi:MAG: hypothetical protein U0R80_06715 [Nocardioidaceae bacterium]
MSLSSMPHQEPRPPLHDDPASDVLELERDHEAPAPSGDATRWRYTSAVHAARTLSAMRRH